MSSIHWTERFNCTAEWACNQRWKTSDATSTIQRHTNHLCFCQRSPCKPELSLFSLHRLPSRVQEHNRKRQRGIVLSSICSSCRPTKNSKAMNRTTTDNHNNTSSLNFYRPDALPDARPTVSEHWRQIHIHYKFHLILYTTHKHLVQVTNVLVDPVDQGPDLLNILR